MAYLSRRRVHTRTRAYTNCVHYATRYARGRDKRLFRDIAKTRTAGTTRTNKLCTKGFGRSTDDGGQLTRTEKEEEYRRLLFVRLTNHRCAHTHTHTRLAVQKPRDPRTSLYTNNRQRSIHISRSWFVKSGRLAGTTTRRATVAGKLRDTQSLPRGVRSSYSEIHGEEGIKAPLENF